MQAITKRIGSSNCSPSATREGEARAHGLEEDFTELAGNSVEAGGGHSRAEVGSM